MTVAAVPAWQRRNADEAVVLPCSDHAADALANVANEVHELRVRERGPKESHAQRVFRCLFEHSQTTRPRMRREIKVGAASSIAKVCEEGADQDSHRRCVGVGLGELVRLEIACTRIEPGYALDDVVALGADRPEMPRTCERVEEHRASGPRGRQDEDRPRERIDGYLLAAAV